MASGGHVHDTYAAANKELFDKKALEVDAMPEFQAVGRDVAAALLRIYPALFDPEKTEALDFVCGTGLVSLHIAPHVKSLVGVDISEGMVARFNERASELGLPPSKARAEAIELKGTGGELGGAKFDIVLCTLAYHHLSSISTTTALLASFLKPGGALLVVDHMATPETRENDVPEEFRNAVKTTAGFSEAQIREVFEGAGLQEFEFGHALTATVLGKERAAFVAKGLLPVKV